MVRGDLEYGQRTIRRILKELEQPQALENKYAEAILAQAKKNAAGKPTPQARMAAENMVVERNTIGPLSGGAPADVAIGSEFGSSIYPQFHRSPNPRGYWLYPAAEDMRVLAETDQELEKLLDRVIASSV
jgi:hypothetical protein